MSNKIPIEGILNKWKSSGKGIQIGSIVGLCCLGLLIFGAIGSMGSDQTTSYDTTSTDTESDPTTTETSTPSTSSSSSSSYLNNPDEVQNVLDLYDANGDGKIEFVDEESDYPDGDEEYALWAYSAGFDSSDSYTLTYMFNMYDDDGDGYWDEFEIDNFFDDN